MSVRTELLWLLEKNRDNYLSGQEIADCLGVTRAAVWKAAKSLIQEGYHVESGKKRGYRLLSDTDVLSAEGISLFLKKEYQGNEIVVHKCIDSTNKEAKRLALEGRKEGLLVLAEEQTKGRGRRGRDFFSPSNTGIYMSVVFHPEKEKADDVVLITTAASVAVCRALRRVLEIEPKIKWVNDIYVNNKKICGILTEAVSDVESGRIETVVVGIGINYRMPKEGFPEELTEIAGSACDGERQIPRNRLVAEIVNELCDCYKELALRTYIQDYKRWSNVLGEQVKFTAIEGIWEYGEAVDIDRDGGLVVRMKNGQEKVLRTGEITLRINEK